MDKQEHPYYAQPGYQIFRQGLLIRHLESDSLVIRVFGEMARSVIFVKSEMEAQATYRSVKFFYKIFLCDVRNVKHVKTDQ